MNAHRPPNDRELAYLNDYLEDVRNAQLVKLYRQRVEPSFAERVIVWAFLVVMFLVSSWLVISA